MRFGDELLRDQNIERLLQAKRAFAVFGQESRHIRLEEIRCEPGNAGCRPCLSVGLQVLPDTGQHIPVGMHIAAVENLQFGLLHITIFHLADGTNPDAFDVTTDPAIGMPAPLATVARGVVDLCHDLPEDIGAVIHRDDIAGFGPCDCERDQQYSNRKEG